jgi:hypothetical protein
MAKPLSDKELDDLETLYDNSTPGPWVVKDLKFVYAPCPCCGVVAECAQYGVQETPDNYNTEIIVAMHSALPSLIKELREARKKLKRRKGK